MHKTLIFDEHNFNELIVGFIGETLRENISRENFDESLAIRQKIHQSFPFALYGVTYLCNT